MGAKAILDCSEVWNDKDPAWQKRIGERIRHPLGIGYLAEGKGGTVVISGLVLKCQRRGCRRGLAGHVAQSAGWAYFYVPDGSMCDLRNEHWRCPRHRKEPCAHEG